MNAAAPFHGWRMAALSFVAYNAGVAIVMNAFGPVMPVLERELGASRAGVSTAFGLFMLALGALAPLVGNLAQWAKLRTLMMSGAAMIAVGFLLLAFANSLLQVLIIYGAVIGTGSCLLAVVAAPNLISRWFEHDRGKALAIGLLQISALVAAPIAAALVAQGGRPLLCFALAGFFAALVPVMSRVIDWPRDIGQSPRRAPTAEIAARDAAPVKSSREILSDPCFWLANLAIGLFTTGGVTLTSHGTAMAVAKGVELTMAATVLSAMGAGTLIGAFAFGWLIDRIGAFRALTVAISLTAIMWLAFTLAPSMPLMAGATFLMGIAMGPTAAFQAACLNEIVGVGSFGRAMGYAFFIKLPFLVGPAPLAGYLYDLWGGYRAVGLMCVAVQGLGVLMALTLIYVNQRRRTQGVAAPAAA